MEKRIIECVPNFSEGRDPVRIDRIVEAFRAKEGVKLLDYSSDYDHNRMVITVAGRPPALGAAVLDAIGIAIELIDLNTHSGVHPRMGAVDVVPFIPLGKCSMDEAIDLAREVAFEAGQRFGLPVFLYEQSASAPHRVNLADVRRGGFEGLDEKLKLPLWAPDFGPSRKHPTAGAVAVGARSPLVAYNVNLDTDRIDVARAIARRVRYSSGGLRFCKAMGVELKTRGATQVSMNMTDYSRTSLYQAFELVKLEARRYGVAVAGSEIIGLVPMEAIADVAGYYLGLEDFSLRQVLEARLWE
ncbi:MAG: glutamate formimidoyltransferase [Tannerellaceae bacterium]|jgi:glutamate formiminotransferase|nr:glutamate formimidoyltransferase [Tannerellaceae bacterium]